MSEQPDRDACWADLGEMIVAFFNRTPLDDQPKAVAFLGTDPVEALDLQGRIRSESRRGREWEEAPLHLISWHGQDFNSQDLSKLVAQLKDLGTDPTREVLYVWSALSRERSSGRPWLSTVDLFCKEEGLPSVVGRNGLVVLQAHRAVGSEPAGANREDLLPAGEFLMKSAAAGLFPQPDRHQKYPKSLPFTSATLSWFEKRPYTIRHTKPFDLEALLQLEAECWPEALRATADEIRTRIESFPQGHCAAVLDGRVVGVIYSQRIERTEPLFGCDFRQAASLHRPDAPFVQLLAANVLPEIQHLGLGDQLLEFMLQYSSSQSGVERVVAVTLCRDYPHHASLPMEEYIQKRSEAGFLLDPILRFHEAHGATIEGAVPGYRPEDTDNQGAGVLVSYDIFNRHRRYTDAAVATEAKEKDAVVEESILEVLGDQRRSAFSPRRSLMDLGLDSLELLELRMLLGRRLGVELDATFFFRYGNARAIVGHLEGRESEVEAASEEVGEGVEVSEPLAVEPLPEEVVEHSARRSTEDIAIVGTACRFPGGVTSPEEYWALLSGGVDAITDIPPSRWDVDRFQGQIATRQGGFLEQVDRFDAAFFRIAPREAEQIDPQQRILLEETWKALENAAIDPESLAGSRTGIFVGVFPHDYELLQVRYSPLAQVDPYYGTGNSMSVAAGRLAYFFGCIGPAVSIDTACSSSLMALHLACQSLKSGECDLAVAAGVNLMLSPELSIAFSHAGMLAPDGRCKTFDASADGYVRSEGCGVVLVKRLPQALSDRDRILAVIRGTAVNQDGASNGLTAPNGLSQEDVIRRALSAAGVSPLEVSYVETHGTGTSLGDPIEVKALKAVYGEGRSADNPLRIGSVKTQIGHTEAAAGLAGLIKVVMSLQQGTIASHLHFREWNPHIELDEFPVSIPQQAEEWKRNDGQSPRMGAVSSFGFSGTNVHAILSEAPEPAPGDSRAGVGSQILTLSAQNEEALRQLAERYLDFFRAQSEQALPSICYTSQLGRSHFDHRLAAVSESVTEFTEQLGSFVEGRKAPGLVAGRVGKEPRIAFLFTGQGAQFPGMARQLYRTQPLFRKALHQCDEILCPYLEASLLDVLYPAAGETSPINDTAYTQPALFALEYCLAELWNSWGIEPDILMGHSVGEYAAACRAGVFSLEDGLKLIAARGRLMQALPLDGEMAVAFTSAETLEPVIEPFPESVAIAGFNGPDNLTISGRREDLQAVLSSLEASGVQTVKLNVSHAFHSRLMDPMLAEFEKVASEIKYSLPRLKMISNITGGMATEEIATPEYWCRHVRMPVRFSTGMETLHQADYSVFVEIGPKPTLLKMGRFCVPEGSGAWLPSLQPGTEDWQQILLSLGELYIRGATVDWKSFERDFTGRRALLPTYPFQRQRYWLRELDESQSVHPDMPSSGGSHPLLGRRLQSALKETLFESRISPDRPAYLEHHRVFDQVVLPASAYMELALAAAGAALHSEDVLLEDVVIGQAMILPKNEITKVQLILVPDSAGASFQIHSLAPGEESPEASWSLHVSGRMQAQLTQQQPPPVDVAALQARCSQAASVAVYYQQFRELRGLDYGESFQAIEQLWLNEGEALGRIQVPPQATDSANYQLHPVALDAAFQILMATFPESARQEVFLPVALERLEVHHSSETEFWAHARVRQDSNSEVVTADLQLFKETGELVAEIDGFTFKRASREAMLRSVQPERNELLHEIQWKPKPLRRSARPVEKEPTTWLIFEDQSRIESSLAQALKTKGDNCLRVSAGEAFDKTSDDQFSIDVSNPESFEQLLKEVAEKEAPLSGVIFGWGLQQHRPEELELDTLKEAQRDGCGALLHLVQALVRAEWPYRPQLWLITRGAQAVGEHPRQVQVEQSPLWGLGRVIRQEHRNLRCVNLDLDSAESNDPVTQLVDDLRSPDQESEIAYRQGQRWVARFVRHRWKAPSIPPKFDPNSSYLITGGLGSLGLEVARWLVQSGARNLVLAGRSGASSQKAKETVSQLEQAGADILVMKADVSRPGDAAGLLEKLTAGMPPLRGVIHAAGVMDEGYLVDQNWDRFQTVLAAKLEGAWNLHCLTRESSLDFFVCFSSVASLLGSPGLGTYAASNAFLDALAHHRQGLGLPALTINWGPWEVGMVDRMGDRQQSGMAAIGLGLLGSDLGIGLLGELLAAGSGQIAVMQMDWSRFLAQFPTGEAPGYFEEAAGEVRRRQSGQPSAATFEALQQLLAADQSQRLPLMTHYLRHLVAGVLGSPPDRIKTETPLNKMGLDSLMALQLRNRIQTELQVDVPMVRFLAQIGLTGLAQLLNDELPEAAASPSTPKDLTAQQPQVEAARDRSVAVVGFSGNSIIEGVL